MHNMTDTIITKHIINVKRKQQSHHLSPQPHQTKPYPSPPLPPHSPVLERLESLPEEHVLRIVGRRHVLGRHPLAVLHHRGVVVVVVVDLLPDRLVLWDGGEM